MNTRLLKVDKDIFVDPLWRQDYVHSILATCTSKRVTVTCIRVCNSQHKGEHYYIDIKPPIPAKTANRLQYLLGDDAQRVNFNRARIASGLDEWNKLFERVGARFRTVYTRRELPRGIRRHFDRKMIVE